MRTVIRHIVARTYRPLLVKWLSKTRVHRQEGLRLEIPPEVFHPGFFFSTQLLLGQLKTLRLENRSFLELGAGSGLLSLFAEAKHARVTATDINPVAVEWLHRNARNNKAMIRIIESDLFDAIPPEKFDLVVINPPYYKKKPQDPAEYAWYCGEKGEYFFKLFRQLPEFVHKESLVLMVLCEGCDLAMIHSAARENGWDRELLRERTNLIEKNFIYRFRHKQES